MRAVVLDAWAVLALLRGEEPALRVLGHYVNQAAAGHTRLVINVVNLGEVLYRLIQLEGRAAAGRHLSRFRAGPIEVAQAREPLVMTAAELKAAHRLSYADAFAVATAQAEGATLATGDPEITALPRAVVRVRRLERGPPAG
jgi:predicted nucleic acid-binding protein